MAYNSRRYNPSRLGKHSGRSGRPTSVVRKQEMGAGSDLGLTPGPTSLYKVLPPKGFAIPNSVTN